MIRVVLPSPLRALANVGAEISVSVSGAVTQRSVLTAIETAHPMLRGTMRDHVTQKRRAFVRFFACERDLSLNDPDAELPERVRSGEEPLLVVGAMAGG
jgi:sulfur-carrier protein